MHVPRPLQFQELDEIGDTDSENNYGISFETNSGQRGSFQDNDISGLIDKAWDIVKVFKRSPLKNEIRQSYMENKKLNLILDTKTGGIV